MNYQINNTPTQTNVEVIVHEGFKEPKGLASDAHKYIMRTVKAKANEIIRLTKAGEIAVLTMNNQFHVIEPYSDLLKPDLCFSVVGFCMFLDGKLMIGVRLAIGDGRQASYVSQESLNHGKQIRCLGRW